MLNSSGLTLSIGSKTSSVAGSPSGFSSTIAKLLVSGFAWAAVRVASPREKPTVTMIPQSSATRLLTLGV